MRSIEEVIAALRNGTAKEHLHTNLELKEDWGQKHGEKLSALANKLNQIITFLVIGVSDEGILQKKTEKWARSTEEVVSQHINVNLDPVQACVRIVCADVDGNWVIIVVLRNPGEVTYWGDKAFCASGTTIHPMEPHEILQLRIQLPGLTDFSKQHFKCPYDENLILHFSTEVSRRENAIDSAAARQSDPLRILRALGLHERQAARILFGNCPYRVITYNAAGDPVKNDKLTGLYRLLLPETIDRVANSTGCSYSSRALKEGFANAVAHAAYFEGDGEIILELYPDKLAVSNLCIRESVYFANRWFSRSHKTVNGLLMEAMRVSGLVDELGRGKNLIFSESIKLGQRAPEVIVEKAGKYERWKLIIHAANDQNFLRVLNRSREIYHNEQKALIAQALVLWRDKAVTEIRNYVDGDFARQFAEVLSGIEGPIFYDEKSDKITLRRWAEVLIGEGKDSKNLSPGEEEKLQAMAYDVLMGGNNGVITPKHIRQFAAMGETKSERVLSSMILARWEKAGVLTKVGHGKYRFVPKSQEELVIQTDLLRLFQSLELPANLETGSLVDLSALLLPSPNLPEGKPLDA